MVVSNHALNRMIERNVLCQNIKLNKKQVKKNRKRAMKRINNVLNNYFAYAISNDKNYKYLYAELAPNGICKKYIVHLDTDNLVTVINRIDFNNEIKKFNIFLKKIGSSVVQGVDVDKVEKTFGDDKFIFSILPFSKSIKSFTFVEFSSDKIIKELINGIDPFTGMPFESNHILKDERVKKALIDLQSRNYNKGNLRNISKEDLTEEEAELYDLLNDWRNDKTKQLNKMTLVLSDKILFGLIKTNLKTKEDLLKINGFSSKKYNEYSDELFKIIQNHKIEA